LLEEEFKPTGAVFQRSSKLETAIYRILKQIAAIVPSVQNRISNSSRQIILERPISELGHYV